MPSRHKQRRAGAAHLLPETPRRPGEKPRQLKQSQRQREARARPQPGSPGRTWDPHTHMCMCHRDEPCSIDAHARILQAGALPS